MRNKMTYADFEAKNYICPFFKDGCLGSECAMWVYIAPNADSYQVGGCCGLVYFTHTDKWIEDEE